MKLGFTGSRAGLSDEQTETVSAFLAEIKPGEFHHGDCVGADEEVLALAVTLGSPWTVCHPPTSRALRAFTSNHQQREPRPYLQRNHTIVHATDHLLACPVTMWEIVSSGTWAAIRYAQRQGTPVTIVWPDGTTTLR